MITKIPDCLRELESSLGLTAEPPPALIGLTILAPPLGTLVADGWNVKQTISKTL